MTKTGIFLKSRKSKKSFIIVFGVSNLKHRKMGSINKNFFSARRIALYNIDVKRLFKSFQYRVYPIIQLNYFIVLVVLYFFRRFNSRAIGNIISQCPNLQNSVYRCKSDPGLTGEN